MKRVGMGIVFLVHVGFARAQFLGGVFSQGATELKNSSAQLAALQLLGSTNQEDYQSLVDGLTGMGAIHGAEYALHQQYFASLGAVNPAVAAMPEVDDILSLAPAISTGLSTAIQRWRSGGGLVSGELSTMVGMDSTLSGLASAELQELRGVLTAESMTMTDAERMGRVRRIDAAVREQYQFMLQCIADGDLLAAQRQQAQQQAGALLGASGLK